MGLTIVERLRGLHDFVPGKDFQDAMADGADEIERLRAEVEALKAANIRLQQALAADPLDQSMANEKLLEQVAEARAEVAALRAAIERAANTLRGDGADDQGDAYDKAQRILDAALEWK